MGLTFQVRNSITNWSQFATTGRPLLATHYRRHVERINTCRALYGVCYSQVSFGEYDQVVTVPLVDHAHRVPVTNANRNEFVRLYLDWILNKGIYEKFRAFYLGFHSVCASNALIVSFHNATLRIFNIRGNFLARWGVVRCVTRRNLMVDQSLDYNLHTDDCLNTNRVLPSPRQSILHRCYDRKRWKYSFVARQNWICASYRKIPNTTVTRLEIESSSKTLLSSFVPSPFCLSVCWAEICRNWI